MSTNNNPRNTSRTLPFVLSGDDDPTVTPIDALKGTVYIKLSSVFGIFQKQDDGSSTNWKRVSINEVQDAKQSVRVASTADQALAGATPLSIDTIALNNGDRVLLKDQAAGAENGIYDFVDDGVGGFTLVRSSDANSDEKVNPGMFVFAEEGAVNADSGWLLSTDNPITLGVTVLTFVKFAIFSSGINNIIDGAGTRSLEGNKHGSNTASGDDSTAFGDGTTASGIGSLSEGTSTTASGNFSHAEGAGSVSSGLFSHAQNSTATASGEASHAEGDGCTASAARAHAEGRQTLASGPNSHAEGNQTTASGSQSHAEGQNTTASGDESHAEGQQTIASGLDSHAEGTNTTASATSSHAEGSGTTASGVASHAEGNNTNATNSRAHAEGSGTTASGPNAHAEGENTTASGTNAHAEGFATLASGSFSHAEGANTVASVTKSHAEGDTTTASALGAHSEGLLTQATADQAHAEGRETRAVATASHSEGHKSRARLYAEHAHASGSDAVIGDMQRRHLMLQAKAAGGVLAVLQLGDIGAPQGELDITAVDNTKQVHWTMKIHATFCEPNVPLSASWWMSVLAISQFGGAPVINYMHVQAEGAARSLGHDANINGGDFPLFASDSPAASRPAPVPPDGEGSLTLSVFDPGSGVVRLAGFDNSGGVGNGYWLAHVEILEIIAP